MKEGRGIYLIVGPAWTFYVGSTVHAGRRWADHRRRLRAGTHVTPRLQRSWRKYGEAAFTFVLIEEVSGDLLSAEQRWLDAAFASGAQIYNVSRRADCPPDYDRHARRHSEATKQKMREAHLGRVFTPERCRNIGIGRSGIPHTEETRRKISERTRGKKRPPRTEEHRARLAIVQRGKKRSPESCARMRAARMAYLERTR